MNSPTPDYPAMGEARAVRTEAREIRMENIAHRDCLMHFEHSARLDRAEADIQTLFSKLGEALSLMYKVDKRLEGLNGKIIGACTVSGTFAGIIMGIVLHFLK